MGMACAWTEPKPSAVSVQKNCQDERQQWYAVVHRGHPCCRTHLQVYTRMAVKLNRATRARTMPIRASLPGTGGPHLPAVHARRR